MNFLDVHAGDEIIIGKIKGVRFWSYQFIDPSKRSPPRTITSFQYDISWVASRPAVSDMEPTLENGRGLNVYKTLRDAMEGSGEAVGAVIEDSHGHWVNTKCGLVFGVVEIWGNVVEHERGYHAQYVQPISFDRAWGGGAESIELVPVVWTTFPRR
jgi:hypothetical protein